jgi:hypothetical protein
MGDPHPSSSSVDEDLSLSLPSSSSSDVQQSPHESSSTTTDHIDNLIETNTVDDALLNDFEKVTREVSNNTLPIENASHLVDDIKNEVTNITKDVIIDESVESFNFSTQEVATSAALDLEGMEMSHSLSAASEGTLSHPVSSPSIEPTAPMESPSEPGAANPLDANATDDNDVDDDIETFEEFKNRKNQDVPNIQQQVLGNIPKGGNNNFASHECGAKVIATNPEAKNPGAILTNNNDEYMLNPCSAEIWFVIELCELVSVSKFEIGCFELFSSIPESFAVYTSDRLVIVNEPTLLPLLKHTHTHMN